MEADQRRQRRLEGRTGGDNEEGPARHQGPQWEPAADSGTGQHADGSFSQAGDSGLLMQTLDPKAHVWLESSINRN